MRHESDKGEARAIVHGIAVCPSAQACEARALLLRLECAIAFARLLLFFFFSSHYPAVTCDQPSESSLEQ